MILARELFAGPDTNGNMRRIWEKIWVRETGAPDLPCTETERFADYSGSPPFEYDERLDRLEITVKEYHRLKKGART